MIACEDRECEIEWVSAILCCLFCFGFEIFRWIRWSEALVFVCSRGLFGYWDSFRCFLFRLYFFLVGSGYFSLLLSVFSSRLLSLCHSTFSLCHSTF
ncbi:hypothetical protein C8J56DRAFT_949728 [Mycena floridula]|nr:hypothetical protein C8J56DRAFT_949728 [Mycena floridula]